MNGSIKLAAAAIILVIIAIIGFSIMGITRIEGNQLGVKEGWDGVQEEPLTPGVHIYCRLTSKIIKYDMDTQIFVMNDVSEADGEIAEGRVKDSYQIQLKGGMDAWVSMALRWHRDPDKIIYHHKNVRKDVEEKVIRKILQRVVKDSATVCTPLNVYAGEGLVQLQKDIDDDLMAHKELIEKGVVPELFVLEGIKLDSKYVDEIKLKQVNVQKALRMEEEKKANVKEAEAAEAKAMIAKKKAIIDAQRNKEVGILEEEMKAAQVGLKADAEKVKRIAEAEGKRDADIAEAKGIEAKGLAEAIVEKAKRDAMYADEAGARRAEVEIWNARVGVLSGIKGVLPEKVVQVLIDHALSDAMKDVVGASK